jgi:RHS repeat-associated protein
MFNYGSGVWTNLLPGGTSEQRMSQYSNPTTHTRLDTMQWATPGGAVMYQITQEYTNYAWGTPLITETIGIGSDARVTRYTYYDYVGYTATASEPPLKSVVRPDGSWEYYSSYDSSGRPVTVLSGIDSALTTSASLCRSIEYSYAPVTSVDDGTLRKDVARKEVEKWKGTIIGLTYRVYQPGQDQVIRCVTPTALYNDPANLITTTRYFTNGPNNGSVQSISNPDRTMSIYDYATNSTGEFQTNIVVNGQPNGGGTAIVAGTSNVTVLGAVGQIISSKTFDVTSGILLSSDNYVFLDAFQRSYTVQHLDGTSETYNFACCGLDSMVDRDGVTTRYLYDGLKRQVCSIRLNITTTNVLDAAGRTVKAFRIGDDNMALTMGQWQYNTANELIYQTNALLGVTSYSRTNDTVTGGLIQTTTLADGGTRIEERYTDGTLKRLYGTAIHGLTNVLGTEVPSGESVSRFYTKEIKLDANVVPTLEWTKEYFDLLSRSYKTVYPDNAVRVSYYNVYGQLTNQVDPDGVSTLYQYNTQGALEFTVLDSYRDAQQHRNGTNRVSYTTTDVLYDSALGTNVQRSRTYVWDTAGVDASNIVSTVETSVDGLRSWEIVWNGVSGITNRSVTVYAGSGFRYVTNTSSEGAYSISTLQNGRLVSVVQKDALGSQISATTYGYDHHGRQGTITDARSGATTYEYNSADLVTAVTTPTPGSGGLPQRTATYYDKKLQATNVLNPDGTSVISEYYLTGELKRKYGTQPYPAAYSYDYAGRMQTMTNWSSFSAGAGVRVTTWKYDGLRGFLTNKVYDGNTAGPFYTYTSGGRLKTRKWARNITTTYSYNNAGDLATIVYSDAVTPNSTNGYDRLGRQTTAICNGITNVMAYGAANQLLSSAWTGGALSGIAVTNAYDQYLRRIAVGLSNQLSTLTQYGYDNAARLLSVTNGNCTAIYGYLANSPLMNQITFRSNGVVAMVTTKQFDNLSRLTSISSVPSASSAISFNYGYNDNNQRTRRSEVDGSYWVYQYDSLGQVVSGKKYWSDGTAVAGQQFEYTFDDIGNRKSTKAGGDENGANLRPASYTANNLNQYSSRDVPGYIDIAGISFATNTVTVNGASTYRRGEYFREELQVDNSLTAIWTNITVAATAQTSVTGNVALAKSPESFIYDADGDLISDGLWTNTWNAENRLISMENRTTLPTSARVKEEWSYLPDGRWYQRIVSTNNGTTWIGQYTNRYVWDGRVLLGILDHTNGLLMSFVHGSDVSGSMQDAGGIGGVLAINFKANGTHFAAYDGNGNVAALVNAGDGTSSAQYEYGPFGEAVRVSGPIARLNPIRFSTQYSDDNANQIKYLYREYNPSTCKWLSKDRIGEKGFTETAVKNLQGFANNVDKESEENYDLVYAYVFNDPIDRYDYLGLSGCWHCGRKIDTALRLTYNDVEKRFRGLGIFKKAKVCATIYLPVGNFAMAWDLNAITWDWEQNMKCGQNTCDTTVTVSGGCYNAWSVNYIAYGWAARFCAMSYTEMLAHIAAWKAMKFKDWEEADQWTGFATAGFFGSFQPPAPKPWNSSCPACNMKQYGSHLDSVWP